MRRLLIISVPALALLAGCSLLSPAPAATVTVTAPAASTDATSAAPLPEPSPEVTAALGLACDDLADAEMLELAFGAALPRVALSTPDADGDTLACGWGDGDQLFGVVLDPTGAAAAPAQMSDLATCDGTSQCYQDAVIGDAWVHLAAGGVTEATPELQALFYNVLGVVQIASGN